MVRTRAALPILALLALVIPPCSAAEPILDEAGFDPDGYGATAFYPVRPAAAPIPQSLMVGAYSHYDRNRPLRPVPTSAPPSPLRRSDAPFALHWTHAGRPTDLEDYLARAPVTGLLIARGDTILYEHYRYGRTPQDRFLSQSMAKTVTGLLVGIALHEGRVRSLDDSAAAYVPELAGSAYGETPIRALLRMSSGVQYRETYEPGDDSAKLGRMLFPRAAPGAVAAVRQFETRIAPPGRQFNYAGAETEVLGLVVARATGVPLSDYLSSRIWAPMGMEAPAGWATDPTGQETAFCCLVATLRDWGRLGLMLAAGGSWNGRQVVPRQWIIDSTTETDPPLAYPGRPASFRGYGNQVWLLGGGAFR